MSIFVGAAAALTEDFLPTFLWLLFCFFLFGAWLGLGLAYPAQILDEAHKVYGTLNPDGWLDHHNAFAIPRKGEARETIVRFCDDACSSRYRIGALYVFFIALDDATMFRLSR